MYGADRHDRWTSAGVAALLMAGIGYMLIAGLGGAVTQRIADELTVIAVLPEHRPPPPDPVPARKQAEKRREGAASPPNLKARATPVVAPRPVILPPVPPAVVVAPVAGQASDPSAGAAPIIGPGTGSGGIGDGTGSGDGGDGDGGGGETPLRLISRKLRSRDLPRALIDAEAHGTVAFRFVVDVRGRVAECEVTRSSGNRDLDQATCDLVKRKLRYRPTLRADGRPRADEVEGEQEWTLDRREEGRDEE